MLMGEIAPRSWPASSSSGLAARTSGFSPMPEQGARLGRDLLGVGDRGRRRLPRRVARPRLPAPGRGRSIVGSGRVNGSSLLRHGSVPRQLRIAQSSIASPGNSPATCMAMPPEFLSWSHSSLL